MLSLYGIERSTFLRRRRVAIERALRSARPVAERAADIAMELLEDRPDMDRSNDRAAATAALTKVLSESNPQTLIKLASAVLDQMYKGDKMVLGGVYGRLMEAAVAIRRQPTEAMVRSLPDGFERAFA